MGEQLWFTPCNTAKPQRRSALVLEPFVLLLRPSHQVAVKPPEDGIQGRLVVLPVVGNPAPNNCVKHMRNIIKAFVALTVTVSGHLLSDDKTTLMSKTLGARSSATGLKIRGVFGRLSGRAGARPYQITYALMGRLEESLHRVCG